MKPRPFILVGESQAQALHAYLKMNWRTLAAQGRPLAVTVALHKEKRHAQQNRLYWAILREISEQAMVGGKRYTDEMWHEFAKGHFLGMVDLPDGRKIGESTTKLSVGEFADYVTKVQAYAVAELGVIFEV